MNQPDPCFMDELPDEPADPIETVPEIRQRVFDREEPGLRSILQHPDALAKAWRHVLHAA